MSDFNLDFFGGNPTQAKANELVAPVETYDPEDYGGLYELYWLRHSMVPTRVGFNREFNTKLTQAKWDKFLGSKVTQLDLTSRGVPLPDDVELKLSSRQMKWIDYLMNPGNKGTMSAKATAFGITLAQHYEWMKNPLFSEALKHATTNLAAAERSRVMNSLIAEATSGNQAAIKFYFELTGEYSARKTVSIENTSEVRLMVSKVVDVLQRHLSAEMLLLVSNDLEKVLFPELNKYQVPPNQKMLDIVDAEVIDE